MRVAHWLPAEATEVTSMTAKQEMRVLVALIVQPLVAAAAAFALFPALDATANAAGVYRARVSDPTGAIAIALATGLAAVPVIVLGALPTIAWLSRRGPLTLAKAVGSGAVLGNAPAAVILLLAALNGDAAAGNGSLDGFLALLRAIAFGSLIGIACGTIFWWIARERPTSVAP
jgi:hypothetical protein